MSIEQRLEQVEKQTKRLRIAVVVLAAALCGVVSMAATESERVRFETVFAKSIFVENDKGDLAVALNTVGNGEGSVSTYSPTGILLSRISSTSNGGHVVVGNKTGEPILTLGADEYGNGVVGVWNRKGKGRRYTSQ